MDGVCGSSPGPGGADGVCAWLNVSEDPSPELVVAHRLFDAAATGAIDPLGERALFALTGGTVIGPDDEGMWLVLGPLELFPRWDQAPDGHGRRGRGRYQDG
jgi:hypothetical protein